MTYNNIITKCPNRFSLGSVSSPEIDRLDKIAKGEFIESLDFLEIKNFESSATSMNNQNTQEGYIFIKQVKSILNFALQEFNDRTKTIIKMRFEDDFTYDEIAKEFNVSRQMIIKIIKRSLLKLREALKGENFILEF